MQNFEPTELPSSGAEVAENRLRKDAKVYVEGQLGHWTYETREGFRQTVSEIMVRLTMANSSALAAHRARPTRPKQPNRKPPKQVGNNALPTYSSRQRFFHSKFISYFQLQVLVSAVLDCEKSVGRKGLFSFENKANSIVSTSGQNNVLCLLRRARPRVNLISPFECDPGFAKAFCGR
jgi:single-stranded DNA-binding protein